VKFLYAFVVSLFAMANLLEAKPVAIPNENATLDIPDTWTIKPTPVTASATPAVTLAATAPDNNSAVEVVVMDNSNGTAADSAAFIEGEKKGLTNTVTTHGGTIQMGDSSNLTLAGVPASCVVYTQTAAGGKPVSSRTYNVAANGKMYMILLQSVDGAQDAALTTVINSLTFSSPPVVPAPHDTALAEKAGEITGYLIAILAVFVILRLLFRRKKTS
jgi:hypothetical protein